MIIRNDQQKAVVVAKIVMLDVSKVWEIKCAEFKPKRSTAMNSLLYAWYAAMAKHTGEGVKYTRGYLKWEYGVPVLLARGEPEFDLLINCIKKTMQYDEIINLFGTNKIAVSSEMKVPEMLDYLQHVEHHCQAERIPLVTR